MTTRISVARLQAQEEAVVNVLEACAREIAECITGGVHHADDVADTLSIMRSHGLRGPGLPCVCDTCGAVCCARYVLQEDGTMQRIPHECDHDGDICGTCSRGHYEIASEAPAPRTETFDALFARTTEESDPT